MNMGKYVLIFILTILFVLSILSGCLDFLNVEQNKIYISTPVKVRYTIEYGYFINTSGVGSYEINYSCCIPKILKGSTSAEILHKKDYWSNNIEGNTFIIWNIKEDENETYKLGVSVEVYAESFIVEDLTGKGALNISAIEDEYPDIFSKYTKDQWLNNEIFVDPDNLQIKTIAEEILRDTDSENAFTVAKNLFKWLKQNIKYELHEENTSVQPAYLTYNKKAGDCDDLSLLYVSLCRSIGLPARLVKGYLLLEENNTINVIPHAWAEVFVGGNIGYRGWIPVECTGESEDLKDEIYQNFAIEDTRHLRTFVDYGSNESLKLYVSELYVRYGGEKNINIDNFVNVIDYQILESKNLVVDIKNNVRYYEKKI